VKKHGLSPEKVRLCFPRVHLFARDERVKRDADCFFYPAAAFVYKNFETVLGAVKELRRSGLKPKVYLTFDGSENEYARSFRDRVSRAGCNESFVFLGRVPQAEVHAMYGRATLLFASRVESFGLPLLEARAAGANIIASDTEFCREILDGYPEAVFFPTLDADSLAASMRRAMSKPGTSADHRKGWEDPMVNSQDNGWSILAGLAIGVGRDTHQLRAEGHSNGV
jgi:glycosyltransferase involved in cell wall biosynthesis